MKLCTYSCTYLIQSILVVIFEVIEYKNIGLKPRFIKKRGLDLKLKFYGGHLGF